MFEVTEDQQVLAADFMKTHSCSLENDELGGKKIGAIGGRFTWSFTPTGLGVIVNISCACGEKEDLTDVESW